jgi:hypothetical protein
MRGRGYRDLWKPQELWASRYIRMPVEIGDGKLTLPKPQDWTIDMRTGTVAIP